MTAVAVLCYSYCFRADVAAATAIIFVTAVAAVAVLCYSYCFRADVAAT